MASNVSKHLVLAAAEEIGTDVSFYRPADGKRLYLTPFVIAALLGSGALAGFCLGLVKGAAEGFGKKIGEAAGGALADKLIERLQGIKKKTLAVNSAHPEAVTSAIDEAGKELDVTIALDLPVLLPGDELEAALARAYDREVEEVKSYLIEAGAPPYDAPAYAQRIVVRIRQEWTGRYAPSGS